MRPPQTSPPRARRLRGVALLVVVTAIAILSIVVLEFSSSARVHLDQGVNLRDEARASALADTALSLTRACLDPKALAVSGISLTSMMKNVEMERVCNLLLGIFSKSRVDLPIGGLSFELSGIQGIGIEKGEIDEIKLESEEAFIGLAGLQCKSRQDFNCGARKIVANRLRSVLCDPEIAHVFENEQADGTRYTREDVVTNLVDWIDSDDNRITLSPLWEFQEGAGENEDGYYGRLPERYKVKDMPLDSIEELRLIRGINDDLYDFLKDKVSVFATNRIDVNRASAEVLGAMLWAASSYGKLAEGEICGKETEGTITEIKSAFRAYAEWIVKVRSVKSMTLAGLLGKPFPSVDRFLEAAKDPLAAYVTELQKAGGDAASPALSELLAGSVANPAIQNLFKLIWGTINQNDLKGGLTTRSNLYRLQAQGTVGNMTRRVFSVLKVDGQIVRTLYYREE